MSVTELLDKFKEIATSPSAQLERYLSEGKKVVAVAPVYTPEEIIHSMGIVPMGVWGADVVVEDAKKYFPTFICTIAQSIVELGMEGVYKGVSAIIIPPLCDTLKVLGENWKYAVPEIPFIPMYYAQNRASEYGGAFIKSGYKRVIDDLEKITGLTFSESALDKSIKVYNRHNQIMRELSELLGDYPQISAEERGYIFKSAYFITKEEHTELVAELISELNVSPKMDISKTRIITSGIMADNQHLLQIFDDNSMQIVADDIASESRQYRVDAPAAETALDSLVKKFQQMENCTLLLDPEKKRADLIVKEAVLKKADGVVVLLTKFCDPEELDWPFVKKSCEEANLPVVIIEIDRQMQNYEQARTIIESFKDVIETREGVMQ